MKKEMYIESIKELLVSSNKLNFLEDYTDESLSSLLKELHEYVNRLEESQKPVYKAMATATKFMPNFILAKLAQDLLTPYIIAQVTTYLEPKASAGIARALKNEFLCNVTLYVVPELTAKIAYYMGVYPVQQIMKEMVKQKYFHRIAELADCLDDNLLKNTVIKIEANDLAIVISYMDNIQKVKLLAKHSNSSQKLKIINYLEHCQDNCRKDYIPYFS